MAIKAAEIRRRLHALLHDDNMVGQYIREFGPVIDIKSIKSLKEAHARASHRTGEEGEGEDPIYEVSVTCPVCSQKDITFYELKAKSQQITRNSFLVPSYRGVTGFKTVDYVMLATALCPRCLFASPDKRDFHRRPAVDGSKTLKSQIPNSVVMGLQEKIGERKAVVRTVANYQEYFKRPRVPDVAIACYRLAMARTSVEAWYEQPYSFYKMGAYALRIAHIMKQNEIDNRGALGEALGFCEEAFRLSNCPNEDIEMQVIYEIVALSLKLGDQRKASSYLGVLANLKNSRMIDMKKNPDLNTVAIDRWAHKAQLLWEDRNEKDLFKSE